MTAYYNVHGQPLPISARDAVQKLFPRAEAAELKTQGVMTVAVRNPGPTHYHDSEILGTGYTEEAAWRNAWSRLLADAMATEGVK